MSVMKYFAPPEWDDDVPEKGNFDNLIKRSKLRKQKKDVPFNEESKNIFQVPTHVKEAQKKRKHIDDECKDVPVTNEDSEKPKKKKKTKHVEHKEVKEKSYLEKIQSFSSKISNVVILKEKKKNNKQNNNVNNANKNSMKKMFKKEQLNISTNNSPVELKSTIEVKGSSPGEVSTLVVKKGLSQTEKNKKRRRKKNSIKPILTPEKSSIKCIPLEKVENKKMKSIDENIEKKGISNGNQKVIKNAYSKKKMQALLLSQSSYNKNKINIHADDILYEDGEGNMAVTNIPKVKLPKSSKSLRERMLERLKGARFRYLNEQMYVKESNDAQKLFKEDPSAFQAYHDGYRQQVNKWPLNPLDVIIKDISSLPKEYLIADLGCGDGRLGKTVPQKVFSFDLVSLNPTVTACDMAHTPLLTSQVNVVVYCLSLMGTNLKEYLLEANRILKEGGLLKIAEVESRFENIENFIKDVGKYGFSLLKSDLNNNLFYFMDFKKDKEIKKRNKLPILTLKPCIYKRR